MVRNRTAAADRSQRRPPRPPGFPCRGAAAMRADRRGDMGRHDLMPSRSDRRRFVGAMSLRVGKSHATSEPRGAGFAVKPRRVRVDGGGVMTSAHAEVAAGSAAEMRQESVRYGAHFNRPRWGDTSQCPRWGMRCSAGLRGTAGQAPHTLLPWRSNSRFHVGSLCKIRASLRGRARRIVCQKNIEAEKEVRSPTQEMSLDGTSVA